MSVGQNKLIMVQIPNIACSHENHRSMNYQFACLNSNCREQGRELACLYCAEDFHKSHMKDVVTIKEILNKLAKEKQSTEYNILDIMLKGIQTCANFQELKTNFTELLSYRDHPDRFEKLMDEEMQNIKINTMRYYQRGHQQELQRTASQNQQSLEKPFISPVLSFKEGTNYSLGSPFTITSKLNELVTVFAYPNLSKFHESIDIRVKINRQTPSWLGIGLSLGQTKFQQKSPNHVLAISNGWISNRGTLQKSRLRFIGGDELRLKWNKSTELLQLVCKREKVTLKLQSKWNEQIYLCVCLFYKGDSVSILA